MQNFLECESCQHKNHVYKYSCEKCHAYLRPKIANLEMSKFLWKLVESPSSAMIELIQSEQKNFTYLLMFGVSLKFLLLSFIFTFHFDSNSKVFDSILPNIGLSIAGTFLFIFLYSFATKMLYSMTEFQIRFRDLVAVNTYSLLPIAIGLVFIFPIELALFGQHWIIGNPSPFLLKPVAAFTLLGIEILIILWSISLSIISNYVQTKNLLLSFGVGILFVVFFIGMAIFFPLI